VNDRNTHEKGINALYFNFAVDWSKNYKANKNKITSSI